MYLTKLARIGPDIKAVNPFSTWAIIPIGPRRLALRATIILLGLFLTFWLIRTPAHSQSFILSEQEVHPLLGEDAPNLRVFVNGPLLRASDSAHPALKGLPLLPSLRRTPLKKVVGAQAQGADNTASTANPTDLRNAVPPESAARESTSSDSGNYESPYPLYVLYGEAGRLLLAITAHRMQDAGVINLDAPLYTLLPDLIEEEPFQVQLTVRHILDGTSGFSVPRGPIDVSKLAQYLVKTQRHGLMYHNDPVGYELLTLALEQASGLSLLEMLNVWALAPAGAPLAPSIGAAASDPTIDQLVLLGLEDYHIIVENPRIPADALPTGIAQVSTARIDRLSGPLAPLVHIAQRLQKRDRSTYLTPASKGLFLEHVSWRMHPMGLRRTLGLSESLVAGRRVLRTMPLEQAAPVPEAENIVRLFTPTRSTSPSSTSLSSTSLSSAPTSSHGGAEQQAWMPPINCMPGVAFVMMPSADMTFLDVRERTGPCTYGFAESAGQLLAQYVPPGDLGDIALAQARGAIMHSLPTGLYVQESAPNASLLARLSSYRHRTERITKIDDTTILFAGTLYRTEAPYALRALTPTPANAQETTPNLPSEQTLPPQDATPKAIARTHSAALDTPPALMTFHPFKAGGYMRLDGQTWRHVGLLGTPAIVLDPFAVLLLIVFSGGIYAKAGHNKAWRHMGRFSLIGAALLAGGIACELAYFEASLFEYGSLWPMVLWRLMLNVGLALILSLPLYAWQFTRKADMPSGPATFIASIHLTILTAASLLLFFMVAAWGLAGRLSPY